MWKLQRLAGVDEAGRGPWAGPVVAAAVVLPQSISLPGLNDSKKLSPSQRDKLYTAIQSYAIDLGIGISSVEEIDRWNILRATMMAMERALLDLSFRPDRILVDGRQSPGLIGWKINTLIKGDSKSASVAAASIVAKVTRDRIMLKASRDFPDYGFEKHKGYGTLLHRKCLAQCGPTPFHRQSFYPIKTFLKLRDMPLKTRDMP